ncbi:MAG: hypothetical protein ACYCPO_06555 [Acidobacteriaceae bacterium]
MIQYPATLKGVGGAKTGIAPVNLLDIQTVDDVLFFWSDRKIIAPTAIQGTPGSATLPVVPVPPGQSVAWSMPTAVALTLPSPTNSGSVTANLNSAFLTEVLGAPTYTYPAAQWSGFPMPAMPLGAVIEAIYPVIIATGTGSGAATGANSNGVIILNGKSGEFQGQYNGSTIGNSAAALAAAFIEVDIKQSLENAFYQDLDVSFVGLAVYYTLPSSPGLPVYTTPPTLGPNGVWPYEPWLLSVPSFAFHRSLQTDIGSFVVQNVSGDTLSRDVERLLRASAMEGAFFVYRLWQPGAQAAWIEVHGTLSVADVGVDTMTLKAAQLLNPSQDDTPLEIYSETCQLNWGQARCGSTAPTECSYSYQTCTSLNRIMIVTNDYEKNFGEATANTAMNVINRRRKI